MANERRRREWERIGQTLEAGSHRRGQENGLDGYQIIRPVLRVPLDRGSIRQLTWALSNWVRPYLNRVRAGIEYDPRLHRPPAEPDWRADRGRGNLPSRLMFPYGDDWESFWDRVGKKRNAAKRAAAKKKGR